MLQLLSRLWKQQAPTVRTAGPRALRRAQLEVETLEGRLVMSGLPLNPAAILTPTIPAAWSATPQKPTIRTDFIMLADEAYVDHLHRDLFHTPADAQTVASLANQLVSAPLARIDVVRSFVFSADYAQVVVQDLF